LSFRDVEELLAERGLDVSYESIRYWVQRFGISGFPDIMILVAERITGLKIHISLFDDENARCNGSSLQVQHNSFFQFIPPSTISSTSSVI